MHKVPVSRSESRKIYLTIHCNVTVLTKQCHSHGFGIALAISAASYSYGPFLPFFGQGEYIGLNAR